jgi:hypothetical protein
MSVWDKRIAKAERFFQKAKEHGRKVYTRYQDKREDEVIGLQRVNIFYANVNTIKESLFNSLPKPDVSRLHKGDYEDDVARVAALILQRALTYEVHCAKSFEGAIKYAILDRLVPGIGQCWVRFEKPKDGPEEIFVDVLYWEDFIYGPARSWEAVPWVGRRHEFTGEEVIERYGKEALSQASSIKDDNNITPKEITEGKFVVYEIWEKKSRKVFHVIVGAAKPIKTVDDPYKLPDFFPCPRPLVANLTTSAFLPVTDYHLAQDQYNELDVLYARMSLISRAVKVAGCYDAASAEIGSMLEGQENKLIPVDNWAMFAERGGANGMIDWYPVEQVVTVFQALAGQYEMVKATLYEVTGMSDIMRGASNQYETASAQEIKAQFASVRMNGYQRDVSEFVRDIMRIISSIMCNLYSDEKFQAICGSFNEADQKLLQPAMQVLRSPLMTQYKVDVEPDSLTQSDWALEKGQRMELTGYISQFLTSAVPAVENAPELGPLLFAMIKFSVAGFKGAAEIEGIIDQQLAALVAKAQNPEPPKPTPEEQKMQLEQQKMQMQSQLEQQKMQMQMQLEQQKGQMEAGLRTQESQQRMELEQQQAFADLAVKRQELANQQEMFAMEMTMKRQEMEYKERELGLKITQQAVAGQMKNDHAREAGEIKTQQMKEQQDAKPNPHPSPKK